MTDFQFDAYADTVAGQTQANGWQGTVFDVDKELFGSGIIATVKMGDEFIPNVELKVTPEEAATIAADAPITFSGKVDEISNTLGMLTITIDEVTWRDCQEVCVSR